MNDSYSRARFEVPFTVIDGCSGGRTTRYESTAGTFIIFPDVHLLREKLGKRKRKINETEREREKKLMKQRKGEREGERKLLNS